MGKRISIFRIKSPFRSSTKATSSQPYKASSTQPNKESKPKLYEKNITVEVVEEETTTGAVKVNEEKMSVPKQHDGPITAISTIQPNLSISGGKDKTIIVQDIVAGKVNRIWNEHKQEITSVASLKTYVASGSRDLSIKIWDLSKNDSLTTMKGHQLVVTCVDFNTDCSLLCSGSRDNSVRIWDINTETCILDNKISRNLVTDIKWMQEENLLIQTSEDKMLKIWDTRLLEVVHTFPVQNQIQTCCDVDGYSCITGNNGFGGRGCEVSLWDLREKSKILDYRSHSESVTGCTFVKSSLNSRFFATSSKDGTVCMWQDNKSQPCTRELLGVGPLTDLVPLNNEILLCGSFSKGIRLIRRNINDQLVHIV